MVFREFLDFPSYPQSFDIAVSPDILSLRNSKSQGKGDRGRRERYIVKQYCFNGKSVVFQELASLTHSYAN